MAASEGAGGGGGDVAPQPIVISHFSQMRKFPSFHVFLRRISFHCLMFQSAARAERGTSPHGLMGHAVVILQRSFRRGL
jgi:hypothetical protein